MFLLNLNYLIFYYLIIDTTIHHVCHCSHSSIQLLEPNKYKGIVIAFSPEIPKEEANNLLTKTKDLITEASKELYIASGRRAYFNEVNFVVPNDWREVFISKSIEPSVIKYKYSEADIIINSNTETQSFTLQYAGCGKHSLPIVLSKGFVSPNGNNNYGNASKLFVHEWAHYRYGVFNEFGFPEDNMYPLYYSIPGKQSDDTTNIHITSCADSQQDFNRLVDKDVNGVECHLNTSNESGLPTKSCLPLPDIANNTFKSSYMYQQAANSVEHFCGFNDHKHNVNSPNKQNVLCNSRDTWSVIMDHPDMKKSKEDDSYIDPNFKYSIDPIPDNIMIAVMNSEIIMNNKRNLWLVAALKKFLKTDLNANSMAKFFHFEGNTTSSMPNNWINANQIIFDIFFNGKQLSNNFSNVLSEGDNAFTGIVSGTFVIVIGGHSIMQSNNIETIAESLRNKNVTLKIIIYPPFITKSDLKNAMEIFEKVLNITGGSVIFVHEDIYTHVNTLHHLFEAFENAIVDYAGGDKQKDYTLKTQTFSAPKGLISFNFSVDQTISSNFSIYFIQTYTLNPGMIDVTSATIINPSNATMTNVPTHKEDNIIIYTVNQGLKGLWSISVSLYDIVNVEPTDSIKAMVRYKSNNLNSWKSNAQKSITANCWINSNKGIHTIDSSNHLTIYVQINKYVDDVVQDANITVELLNDLHEKVGTVITLLDDGLGDPDITAGDGIYSQYITGFETDGIYYITAYVMSKKGNVKIVSRFGSTSLPTKHDSNSKFCCGSKIPEANVDLINSEFLVRQIDCGSVYVFVNQPSTSYPPNSIRSLRVNNTDSSSRTVDLVWTAPGGDLTSGVIQKYLIKAFVGSEEDRALREAIITSFDSKSSARIEYDQIVPLNYGSEQKATVKIGSEDGGVYHFAIKSFNRNNIGSAVSNIAIAYIVAVPKQTAKIAGIDWWLFLVILIACILILVFVIIFIICFICKRRRKNEDREPTYKIDPPQRRAPEPPRISPQLSKNSSIHIENGSLTHSIDKIPDNNPVFTNTNTNTNNNLNNNTNNNVHNNYNPGSEPSLRELNVNTLSPVQSWDAKDLLSHWGRVQEAKQKRETPPVMRIEDIEVNSTPSHRSLSYASSDDDNSATYSRPGTWRYQNLNAKPTYIGSGYPEPALRGSIDPMRSNTPSDSVPRYSTVNRRPITTVSQV